MSIDLLLASLADVEIIELGQILEENMPAHPSQSRFFRMLWHSKKFGDPCFDYQIIMNEHTGTHVDSYAHFIDRPGFESVEKIPIDKFCGRCISIDATFLKERETVEKEDIIDWEKSHGEILPNTIVLLETGWMKYWNTRPNDRKFIHDFPGLGLSGAQYLSLKKIKMLGIDTVAADADGAIGDPVHTLLLSSRIPIVENLRNLNKLHGKTGYFIMLPLLIRDGTASPVRPIALIEKGKINLDAASL